MGQPQPIFSLFSVFSIKYYTFYNNVNNAKMSIQYLSVTGIRTHNLLIMSLLPQPLDH